MTFRIEHFTLSFTKWHYLPLEQQVIEICNHYSNPNWSLTGRKDGTLAGGAALTPLIHK
jgi:hypothetical protein